MLMLLKCVFIPNLKTRQMIYIDGLNKYLRSYLIKKLCILEDICKKQGGPVLEEPGVNNPDIYHAISVWGVVK